MHDEMMVLFDDCIERMLRLRGQLAASRRVHPGERQATVFDAIEVAEHFAAEATRTVRSAPPSTPPVPQPAAAGSPESLAASMEPVTVGAGSRATLTAAH